MPPDQTPSNRPAPAPAWHGRRGEWLVVIQFALFLAFALAPRWNPWLTPDLLAETVAPRWAVLVVCALVALAFGGLGSRALGPYLTPLPYPVDHSQLVTSGVYAVVRHPLYSALLFAALGWVCYTLSLSHLALLLIGGLFFDYKAGKEERWLTERHPDYPGYAARARKFVPWVY
ncbi:isoprenylcysteine carboxylmethyltransferase family protein [uncultured Thiodictyon sp.]|uniref:methyltransferase family protein n=1 Tax=uncultured Thiodictyon sp. TaxID=1846217 RepID=UPI0025E56E69|nr:isoprenylcysteine carboxylmethyltransferase family protein [uncultured Thiodictyon sp.]